MNGCAGVEKHGFAENGPCRQCGSTEDLELDHIDPTTKISHAVWSWSEQRRAEELKKCQVLCHNYHETKTLKQVSDERCAES